jgi:outer membrane lipoprotein
MRSVLRGIVLLLSLSGCATSDLVPTQLQSQISREISYGDIKADPERFKGRIVVVGGHVLSVKRLKDRTEIEVLQLPLDRSDHPVPNLMNSKGRFFAFSQSELNPATVPPGSQISMVVEVLGSQTVTLDDKIYTHCTHPPQAIDPLHLRSNGCPDRLFTRSPTFTIKVFKVWPKPPQYARPLPFWDSWGYPFDDP